MALPAVTRNLVELKLERYCRKKVPKQEWNRLRVVYRIEGSNVMLIWSRPSCQDPTEWIETVLAMFRYNSRKEKWTLYWADQNNICHRYESFKASKELADLIREVDDDPTGIFWG